MAKYLAVNTGSASKKYALFSEDREILKVHFEREEDGVIATIEEGGKAQKSKVSQEDYDSALEYFLRESSARKIIAGNSDIRAAAVRIVAPGNYFLTNRIINAEYNAKLEEAVRQAPLHLKPAMREIEKLKLNLPGVSIAGVSDSAFHASLPQPARLYNLPQELAEKFGIYRFGYHGISAQSVLEKVGAALKNIPPRTVICHLGSGASVHAVKDGKSFDTSMGFTPLEGLTMGTRIGNIDAGAVLFLLRKSGMSPAELEEYFNTRCGLLALSGKTSDIRELLELEKKGDEGAETALEAFVYSVCKYVGAYSAGMGGLDLLAFTATIGERSDVMRERICGRLGSLGVGIDKEKNNKIVSRDGFIEKEGASSVRVAVLTADEMGQMVKELRSLIKSG